MKKVLVGIMILALSSGAFASISLSWEITPLTGGLYETVVTLNDDTSYSGAFATSDMVFTAGAGVAFNQVKISGVVDVDVESTAVPLGYTLDTYYYDVSASWGEIAPDLTDVTGTAVLTLDNLGSGTTTYWGPNAEIPLIRIVSNAGKIVVTGSATQAEGGMSDVGCEIIVPEPVTMSLLGVGALALLRRRK